MAWGWQEGAVRWPFEACGWRGIEENNLKHGNNSVPFAPGRSGNPNGRPAGSINRVSRLSREAALEYAPAIVKELARIALNDDNIALRIAAGKEILDRAYGKPHRQLDDLDQDRLDRKIRNQEEYFGIIPRRSRSLLHIRPYASQLAEA
jgi:hypothetical protein